MFLIWFYFKYKKSLEYYQLSEGFSDTKHLLNRYDTSPCQIELLVYILNKKDRCEYYTLHIHLRPII